MKVNTSRFGEIKVEEESIILIPRGLLGFPDNKSYFVVQSSPDTPLRWLQSVEVPDLAFIIVDPCNYFENYEVEISDEDAQNLCIQNPEDAVVATIVTVNRDGEITTNLLGPLVINSKTLLGMQVILQNDNYKTKHTIGMVGESQAEPERSLANVA